MKLLIFLLSSGLIGGSIGCASQGPYYWGQYEQRLQSAYDDPGRHEDFVVHLAEIITEAEKRGKRIPPGISAEYGYAMYRSGQLDQAIVSLRREAELWPQSAALMNRLIERIQAASMQTKPEGVASDARRTLNTVESDKESQQMGGDE